MKIRDKVIHICDCDSSASIRSGTVTDLPLDRRSRNYGYIQVDGEWIMSAFVFPASYEEKLRGILDAREKAKRAFDNLMKPIYELRNKMVREDE